jgi:hypothetical protein
VPTNIQELKKQMRADFKNKKFGPVAEILEEAQKAIASFLYIALMRTTPVKTGELVGGWTFYRSSVKHGGVGRINKYRIVPPVEVGVLDAQPRGFDITIANGVEYSEEVNNASSYVNLAFAELMSYARIKGVTVRPL